MTRSNYPKLGTVNHWGDQWQRNFKHDDIRGIRDGRELNARQLRSLWGAEGAREIIHARRTVPPVQTPRPDATELRQYRTFKNHIGQMLAMALRHIANGSPEGAEIVANEIGVDGAWNVHSDFDTPRGWKVQFSSAFTRCDHCGRWKPAARTHCARCIAAAPICGHCNIRRANPMRLYLIGSDGRSFRACSRCFEQAHHWEGDAANRRRLAPDTGAPKAYSFKPSALIGRSTRAAIGFELETEYDTKDARRKLCRAIHDNYPPEHLCCKRDGSLTPEKHAEIVSGYGRFAAICRLMRSAVDIAAQHGATTGARCGLHISLGRELLTARAIGQIIYFWGTNQQFLAPWTGREPNLYCVVPGVTKDPREIDYLAGYSDHHHAIDARRGSHIEFRQFQSGLNFRLNRARLALVGELATFCKERRAPHELTGENFLTFLRSRQARTARAALSALKTAPRN